jgi:hypothetical protein
LAQLYANHRIPGKTLAALGHYLASQTIPISSDEVTSGIHKENDHVDQDYPGSRARVRHHLRRSGVRWSKNLRVQHDAVRQLGHLDRPLLRLIHVGRDWPVTRKRMMETLFILVALATVAIPVLTEFAAAATHLFAGKFAEDGIGNGSENWELSR